MLKIFLPVIAILALTDIASAGSVTSAEVIEYGVFDKIGSVGRTKVNGVLSGQIDEVTEARIKEQTSTIVAALGTSFGIRVKLTGSPTGEMINCSVRVIHPKLTNPKSSQASERDEWPSQRRIGYPMRVGYTFDHPWELVPGKWTIQIIYESKVVAEKTFDVVLPGQASNQSVELTAARRNDPVFRWLDPLHFERSPLSVGGSSLLSR